MAANTLTARTGPLASAKVSEQPGGYCTASNVAVTAVRRCANGFSPTAAQRSAVAGSENCAP